ncbi:hypothetical protein POM88_015451 [Heracleum sosnowskyi]|uniref:Uncharacterized protein n=1 Tax=Heracleum sosnowskyi TaxID=360622 RepID=A0AAD8MXF9_9APIA|nr:hypothetical protein POM88_015451 [Heracleum sosnowskyi]
MDILIEVHMIVYREAGISDGEMFSLLGELVGSNGDLLRKIFLLLLVPPLVRFKYISKLWLSLLTEPRFCQNHFLRHRDASSVIPSGIFFISPVNSHVFALFFPKSSANIPSQYSILQGGFGLVKIVQSCNELQLVRVITHDHQSKLYFVGNMTTPQIKMIPLPELNDASRSYFFYNLAFNPLKSQHYKIVCAKRVNSDQCQFDIYSSKTGE